MYNILPFSIFCITLFFSNSIYLAESTHNCDIYWISFSPSLLLIESSFHVTFYSLFSLRLSPEEKKTQPLAGSVFRIKNLGTHGSPAKAFDGWKECTNFEITYSFD